MISLVIPYLQVNANKAKLLGKFLESVHGQFDELVIVSEDIKNLASKMNTGIRRSSGDFIILANDDLFLFKGTLRDLPKEGVVTHPLVNGRQNSFGCIFCQPRSVFDMTGGMYEGYDSFYCEDEDYLRTLKSAKIPIEVVRSVDLDHPVSGGTTAHTFIDHMEKNKINKELFFKRWGEQLL